MPESPTNGRLTQRLWPIDALRGGAIAIMIAFHFCFDLSYFKLADFNFYRDPFWLSARAFIVSSFLFLVGVSLMLASYANVELARILRRTGVLLAAALLISVVTYWQFGDRLITFGVIHFIAVASILGLAFRNLGHWNLLLGILWIVAGLTVQNPIFDAKALNWVGFMTGKPSTEDYVPLFPWFGVVLLGMYCAPWVARWTQGKAHTEPSALSRLLAWGGRHSLIIYLLHQPILMGLVYGFVFLRS